MLPQQGTWASSPVRELQYCVHPMQTADSLERTPMLGTTDGIRRGGQQRVRWPGGITSSWTWTNPGKWWGTGRPGVRQSLGLQSRTGLGDWTRATGSWGPRTAQYAAKTNAKQKADPNPQTLLPTTHAQQINSFKNKTTGSKWSHS